MAAGPLGSLLAVDGKPVAAAQVAATFSSRLKGLLGRDGIAGALLLSPARSIHTLGMRFPIDVAHLDNGRRVLAVTCMAPWHIGRPVAGSHEVLEAEAGAFAEWGLEVGSSVAIVSGHCRQAA